MLIRDLALAIKEISRVRFALLYGSFLEGVDFHDIDIGVWMRPVPPIDIAWREESRLSEQLERRVLFKMDVKILNHAPLLFQYQVSLGRLIFYRDQAEFFSFLEQVRSTYFDFQFYLNSYKQNFCADHSGE